VNLKGTGLLGPMHRSEVVLLLIIVSLFFIWSPTAFSEIYQWTDEKGNAVYSDSPPPGFDARPKKLRSDRIERPEIKNLPAKAAKEPPRKRDLRDITVILYAADW